MPVATKTPTKKTETKRTPRQATPPEPITVVTLPADQFVTAWTNVARAQSDDGYRPILEAMCIEIHGPEQVRLIATNSYYLLHSFVGGDAPDLDVEPVSSCLAGDPQKTLKPFMSWLTAAVKRDKRPPLGSKNAPDARRVTITITDDKITIDAGDAAVVLEHRRGDFPSWRKLFSYVAKGKTEAAAIAFNPKFMATICGVKTGDYSTAIQFDPFVDPLKPVTFRIQASPPVAGLIMPVRVS
jgi:hypothetical protein